MVFAVIYFILFSEFLGGTLGQRRLGVRQQADPTPN
jgi:hypothetical protein